MICLLYLGNSFGFHNFKESGKKRYNAFTRSTDKQGFNKLPTNLVHIIIPHESFDAFNTLVTRKNNF